MANVLLSIAGTCRGIDGSSQSYSTLGDVAMGSIGRAQGRFNVCLASVTIVLEAFRVPDLPFLNPEPSPPNSTVRSKWRTTNK